MAPSVGDLERRQVLAEIRRFCAPDNTTNWIVLAREYALLFLVVSLSVGCFHWLVTLHRSLWWMVPIYLFSVMFIGAWTQNRLAVLIHESSHYSLFKNRLLNELAANLLVAFPLFAAITNYRVGHWSHHRHVNDPDHDPDLKRLQKHHPRNFPIGRWKFFWEYLVLQLFPHNGLSYMFGRASYATIPTKAVEPVKNLEVLSRFQLRALRLAYYVVLFGMLTWFGWWPDYVLLWLVPMFTFYPAVLFLREIAHHGNYPDNGDFTNSRVYEGKWLEREIFFPFSERNHVLHHLFPSIPWHKIPEAHEFMLRYPPYRENVVVCDGFFLKGDRTNDHPTVLDILAKPSHTYLPCVAEGVGHFRIRQTTATEVGSVGRFAESYHAGES
jgi:fatty acid desaturase